jgi:hypothetical protein
MIETPRAALTAGALAEHADFFSFGTNDLTQLTYAFSRDDVESRLLPAYLAHGILPANPFAELDRDGVGELVRIACEAARAAKPSIKLGACGEHAGHPASTDYLVRLGLDSVSCSPFRVPLARLGVAQALLACGRVNINEVDFGTVATDDAAPTDSPEPDRPAAGATHTPGLLIDEALVLHVLRVKGFVTSDGFLASLGEHPAEILDDLLERGLVRYLEARGMYGLLPAGKEYQAGLLGTYATDEIRAGLHSHYTRFLELNAEFKRVCTTWQVRDGAPNDHSDASYDARCTEALESLAASSRSVIAQLAEVLPRLARYDTRLAAAAERVAAGEAKQFTGVMCESFHDIWMELHEDLIVLQGVDRVAEGSF